MEEINAEHQHDWRHCEEHGGFGFVSDCIVCKTLTDPNISHTIPNDADLHIGDIKPGKVEWVPTIADQMKELDRQGLLDMLDCIIDISSDSTKGQLVYMIQNFRDSIERRKG